MPNDHKKNPDEDSSRTSLPSASSEEESRHVPSSLPSSSQCPEGRSALHGQHFRNVTESSTSTAIVEPATSSLNGGDGGVVRPKDHKAPSLSTLESVSDLEGHPVDHTTSPDTPTSSSEERSSDNECRICLEGHQETQPLLSLCRCSGTMGFMHARCLEHWLNYQNVDVCEFCSERFPVVVLPLSVLRFFDYLSQSDGGLWPALLCDLLVFALMIMFTATCVSWIVQSLVSDEHQWNISSWVSAVFMLYYAIVGLTCMHIGVFNKLRDWYHRFLAWQLAHPVRRIVPAPSVE